MLDERNPNTTTRPAGADEARQDLDDLTVLGKIGDTNLGEPRLNLARGGEADESKLGSLATIHQGSRGAPEVTDMTGLMTGGGVAVATDVAVEGGRVARTEVAGLETGGGDGGEVTGSAEMRSQTVEPTRTAWTPEFFAASGESRPSGGVAAADAPLFAASMIGGEGGGSAPAMVMPSEDNPVMAVLPEPTLEPDTEDEEEDEPIVTDDDVNAAPVVIGVTGGVGVEDHEVTGAVLASDADGDRLTYAIAEDGAPLHGSLVLGLDGAYTYLPAPDWSGTDAFTVIVSDGHGGTVTRTVTVEVAADNDVPVVTGIVGGSGLEDHVVTGRVVVADVDGDGLSYALAEGGAPAHGTVAFAADGSYAYVPAEDWSGGDSFTVTVADGHGGSVTRTIAVTVAPVADTPELAAGAGAGTMADDHDDLGAPTSDTIVLGHGGPVGYGGAGDDTFVGGSGLVTVFAGSGDDVVLNGPGRYATVVGGSGSDTITTGQGDELVFGDAMTEGAGVLVPLVIDAGLADTDGSESLAIALSGLPDGATLVDGSGAAVGTLSGGAWMLTPDQLGGLAIALPDGAPTSFTLTVSAGATEAVGGDAAWTSVPVSVALGTIGEGDDVIATGLGKDTVHGGGGDDVIHGEGGADRLFGGSGDDVILGGDQGDVIVGGAGDDVLVGGDHADTFLFELGSGHDMVDGGDRNWTDTIDLTGLTPGTGFTITTESGESWTVAADEAQHELDLGDNVAGTIVTDAGDRIDFENIEEVRW